jgi:hypothetical protein
MEVPRDCGVRETRTGDGAEELGGEEVEESGGLEPAGDYEGEGEGGVKETCGREKGRLGGQHGTMRARVEGGGMREGRKENDDEPGVIR